VAGEGESLGGILIREMVRSTSCAILFPMVRNCIIVSNLLARLLEHRKLREEPRIRFIKSISWQLISKSLNSHATLAPGTEGPHGNDRQPLLHDRRQSDPAPPSTHHPTIAPTTQHPRSPPIHPQSIHPSIHHPIESGPALLAKNKSNVKTAWPCSHRRYPLCLT
jgi:hypothetical protein